MPKLNIFDRKGKKVGTYNVEPTDFAPRISKQLLHDAVVMYQANARQGSHQTKSRGMVAGSTKKMYRQKGTGNARAGSKRSGIRRGGGHIHRIHNRDYSYRMPRKALQTAVRMALAAKVRDDEIVVIDNLSFDAPTTKEMVSVIKHVGCEGSSVLVTTAGYDVNVYRSGRNIAGVTVSPAAELNAFNVLSAKRLLMTKDALDALVNLAKAANANKNKSEGAHAKRVTTKEVAPRKRVAKTKTE